MEEVLTGEIGDELSALTDRSAVLIDQLSKQAANHVASSLSPQELAGWCCQRDGRDRAEAINATDEQGTFPVPVPHQNGTT